MKHIWSILCQRSVVDHETNNISLFDVLEKLNVTVEPKKGKEKDPNFLKQAIKPMNIPVSFELVNLFMKEIEGKLEKAEMKLVIYDPEGNKTKEINKEITIPENFQRIRIRGKIGSMMLTKSGIYNFVISMGNKKVAEVPLEVSIAIKGN